MELNREQGSVPSECGSLNTTPGDSPSFVSGSVSILALVERFQGFQSIALGVPQTVRTGNPPAATSSAVSTPCHSASSDIQNPLAISSVLLSEEEIQTMPPCAPRGFTTCHLSAVTSAVVSTLGHSVNSASGESNSTMTLSLYGEEAKRNATCKTLGPEGLTFTADAMYLLCPPKTWMEMLEGPESRVSVFKEAVSKIFRSTLKQQVSSIRNTRSRDVRYRERLEELCARVPPMQVQLEVHFGVLGNPKNFLRLISPPDPELPGQPLIMKTFPAKFQVDMPNVVVTDLELKAHLVQEFKNAIEKDYPSIMKQPCYMGKTNSKLCRENEEVLCDVYKAWRGANLGALHERAKGYTVKIWVKEDGSDVEGELRHKADGEIVYSIP